MQRKDMAHCKDASGFRQNLNPGRNCSTANQCRSMLCNKDTFSCEGQVEDTNCNTHEDCNTQLFCKVMNEWPFQSKCKKYLSTGEPCFSDFECGITDFCWYANPADVASDKANKDVLKTFRKCMPKYDAVDGTTFGWSQNASTSITIDDYLRNGLFCESGLAYNAANNTARCTSANGLNWNGSPTMYPYKCDPTDLT